MSIQTNFFPALLVCVVTLVTGCSDAPPGCADSQTIKTFRDWVVKDANEGAARRQKIPDTRIGPEALKKFNSEMKLEIKGIVSEGFNQGAKKQFCKGTMNLTVFDGVTVERAVEYSTQKTEDQKGAFILESQDFHDISYSVWYALHNYKIK